MSNAAVCLLMQLLSEQFAVQTDSVRINFLLITGWADAVLKKSSVMILIQFLIKHWLKIKI